MNRPDQFERMAALFEHARGLEPEARIAYLDLECVEEPELRGQVNALLDRHDRGGLLDDPIRPSDVSAEPMPERIGHFRIIDCLGRGGMGVVYRAEQDQPHRQVALKMMHAGLISEQLRRRFEFETSVLARLQHAGIAQIYEAGTSDAGSGPRPFFAMELVDGVTLDKFIAQAQPSIETRLRLFIAICDAVQHAHQKGVIHRDLKPANILVTEDGAPKILDFGVARATDTDVQATLFTTPGQIVGTLAYMSPEQVSMDTDKLDTRSDVYSLGVILYELLAERLPYEVASGSIAGAIRVIEEAEPKSLTSTSRALRGDLDTIVLRSLRKRPEDRYQSASDLAADIRRFLEHQPIFARPATAFYHLSRFARRNRAFVGGVAVAFVALVVGFSLSIYALQVASQERDENDAVTRFLSEMMASADPAREGRNARVIDLLEAASQRVGQEFVTQPLVAAKLHHVIGTTYQALGVYDRAESHLQIAFDARLELLKEKALPTIDSMVELGVVYNHWGKYDLSQPLLERSLELYLDRVGEEHDSTLAAMGELGLLYVRRGRRDLAAPLYHRCLDLRRQLFGNEHPDTLTAMNNLGVMYKKMGQYVQAEGLYEETLSIRRRVLGEEHYDTLTSMNNLAHLFRALGRLTDSADLHAKTLEVRRRVLGNEHPHTQMSMDNLAMLLYDLDRFDEAETLYDEALGLKRRVLGEEHPETLVSMDNLGRLYCRLKRTEEAAALQSQALDVRRRILGTRHENTAISMMGLAATYTSMERFDEAERLFIEALEILRDLLGDNHIEVARCLQHFAAMRLEQSRFVAAEEMYREVLTIQLASAHPNDSKIALAQTNLAQALKGRQHWEEAERMLLAANELVTELPSTIRRSQIAEKLILLYEAWHVAVPDQGYDVEAKRWRDRQANRGAATANP